MSSRLLQPRPPAVSGSHASSNPAVEAVTRARRGLKPDRQTEDPKQLGITGSQSTRRGVSSAYVPRSTLSSAAPSAQSIRPTPILRRTTSEMLPSTIRSSSSAATPPERSTSTPPQSSDMPTAQLTPRSPAAQSKSRSDATKGPAASGSQPKRSLTGKSQVAPSTQLRTQSSRALRTTSGSTEDTASSSFVGRTAQRRSERASQRARTEHPERDHIRDAILERIQLLQTLYDQQHWNLELERALEGDEDDEDVQVAIAMSLSEQHPSNTGQNADEGSSSAGALPNISGRGNTRGTNMPSEMPPQEMQQLRSTLLQLRRQRLFGALSEAAGLGMEVVIDHPPHISPEVVLRHLLGSDLFGPRFELPDMSYEALLQLEDVKIGVGEDFLHSMPVMIFDPAVCPAKECPICLEEYEAGQALTILCCTHRFHLECCQTWLKDHKTCPVCKSDVMKDG